MKNPHCVGNWNPKKCVWQPTFKKFEKWLKDSTTDIHPGNMSWKEFMIQDNCFESCSQIFYMFENKLQYIQGDIEFQFHIKSDFDKCYIKILDDDELNPYMNRKILLKDIKSITF